MYLRPAPGRVVRDPDLRDFLPEAGREVPDTSYWHRRLRDGDVVPGAAKKAAKPIPDRSAQA